ncbi:MAG: outer membrane beta-barrel protein [Flavobacteriaceae bacterium]|nr:outer membrane beta-barrel protein [Flavobacteriaceae bacterium]MDZ4147033.1 outer membrane beta-barrel protein [Flavobacteriaceae bacterium]
MKQLILAACFAAFISTHAQTKIGGKIAYGSEIESFGIGAKATFALDSKFSISPEIVYFTENDNVSVFELNADLHYRLDNNWSGFKPYLIGGFNYVDLDVDNRFNESSDSEAGINLGFGAEYPLSSDFSFITEIKYVLSDFDQLVIGIGFLYRL